MPNHLQKLYVSLQDQLDSDLRIGQKALTHPVSKGDSNEADWLKALKDHLPHRYQASRAFVIDSAGRKSEQIDVVIYDRQYTPILYNKNDQRLIPAESVYAVFEVRPTLNHKNILYAGKKAASVRKLLRTSAEIAYAGGKYEPRTPFPIIGGILTYKSDWKPSLGKTFISSLGKLAVNSRLDIGCVVTAGAFEVRYFSDKVEIECNGPQMSLASFLFRLLAKLQSLATVPAIDYQKYNKWLI
jgi:hypothetical protein